MAWWQKKLLRYGLRYGLQKTGFLDDEAIDLDNLDITIGTKNVFELKDVGLNIEKITKLAQLPTCIRIETARILLLRLTLPADFYQSSIIVEVDGINIIARMQEEEEELASQQPGSNTRSRSPVTARTPQHRKANRRLHSPPPYDPGGSQTSGDLHIPTAEEVAQSFLREEPMQERQQIEASVAANSRLLEESVASESSDGEIGTGTGLGLPGFLSNFLQGLVDRLKVNIRNIELRVENVYPNETQNTFPITLRLSLGMLDLDRQQVHEDSSSSSEKRQVSLHDISIDLLSNDDTLTGLCDIPSRSSFNSSRSTQDDPDPKLVPSIVGGNRRHSVPSTTGSIGAASVELEDQSMQQTMLEPPPSSSPSRSLRSNMDGSHSTLDPDRFADALSDGDYVHEARSTDLDIQLGDDNISWGSRRSQSSAPAEDLWRSMISDDDLPDPLVFQPDAFSAPRPPSSRSSSSVATRKDNATSPFERRFQSPGSWPRLDDSPDRQRLAPSPGSWPLADQRHYSNFDPLAEVLMPGQPDTTDNKLSALHLRNVQESFTEQVPVAQDPANEDMLESKVFSHEDAQSMYMSAMTGSHDVPVPGGWQSDGQSDVQSDTRPQESTSSEDILPGDTELNQEPVRQSARNGSGNATPRAYSPELHEKARASPPNAEISQSTIELLFINFVSLCIPVVSSVLREHEASSTNLESHQLVHAEIRETSMPGTFSAYSEMSSSQRRGAASVSTEADRTLWAQNETKRAKFSQSFEMVVDSISCQLDAPTGRILYSLGSKFVAASALEERQSSRNGRSGGTQFFPGVAFSVNSLRLSLRDHIATGSTLREQCSVGDAAINIAAEQLNVQSGSDTSISLGNITILLGGKDLLSFERSSTDTVPAGASDQPHAVAINILNRIAASNRSITDVSLQTRPVHLTLDVAVVDEVLGSFGGLSGMLELGNSILVESGARSPSMARSSKGVRFAEELGQTSLDPELKLNCRIAGLTVEVRSSSCAAVLRTTTLKAVYREQGAVGTIENIRISAPHVVEDHGNAPITVDLATIRAEYLVTPQDKDLERLLSLLTPSKDKFESDDDILIDTLLRQRRKGSLVRFAVGDAKLFVRDWKFLATLSEFGNELSKLSAVAKYLPEDERPGLLTLVRVKGMEAHLPVNDRFGSLRLFSRDLHLAHVGLPALIAFSIDEIGANQLDGPELIHPLTPLAGSESLPAVMARMLGDEEEPTIKVKLFNVCIEYSVPVLLALTSMDLETEVEEVVNIMAQSVADLAVFENAIQLERSPGSDLSKQATKRMTINLLVHDSAIGLTPQNLPSKALMIVSDGHFSTKAPLGESISARLDLRKASLMLINHYLKGENHIANKQHTLTDYGNAPHSLASALQRDGFVQVASVMAMVVNFRAEGLSEPDLRKAEADVKNDLLLLETCADSTQTLIATLSGLAPPTPPAKIPRYLTEPAIPIEDLMNSFSGEALTVPQSTNEVLYDVEENLEEFPTDLAMSKSIFEDSDDLLAESAMTGSLYGPTSAMFDMLPENEDENLRGDEYSETAESLLEEDPFEVTNAHDVCMADAALMRDLARQCHSKIKAEAIDLGIHEIEDLGFDALGSDTSVLGGKNRFNTPHSGGRGQIGKAHQPNLPFKLRLRDFHVIWHLYDGFDWQTTRDGIADAVESVERRAEEREALRRHSYNQRDDDESVIGDFLFNSIYIGVPSGHDAQELRRAINRNIDPDVSDTTSIPVSGISRPTTAYSATGQPRQRQNRRLKLGRSKSHKIAFELKGVSVDFVLYPPDSGEVVNSVDLRLKDFEIFDNMPSSTWRKFLTHLTNDPSAREMAKPMFHIQLDNVKTLESHSALEFRIHVTVLPLRLHVDQDALDFITRFFEFKDDSGPQPLSDSEKPFIQRIEVDTVDMCLDYKPKKLDYAGLRSGKTTEFINFITLDAANIRLKHAIAYGVKSFEDLHPTLNDIWMPDIRRNQLPTILAGLAPVRGLVNIGSGVRDVVAIPIREYQKDGRIVRSVQKGAFHFGKTTTSELARLGAKVALGTQTLLSNAEALLSPRQGASPWPSGSRPGSSDQGWHDMAINEDVSEPKRTVSAYANQPLGFFSGLRSARRYLEHDLLTARDALIAVQGEFLDSSSPGEMASAVGRHAPTVILRPIIGGMRAVGTTLLGVGNQLDREGLRKVEDKYKKI